MINRFRCMFFDLQAKLHRMTSQWHWTLKDHSMCYINCPWVSIFTSLTLQLQRFRVTILRQLHRITPKWPWTQYEVKGTVHIYLISDPAVSLRFALRALGFKFTCHFETSEVNDQISQWILHAQSWYTYVLLLPSISKYNIFSSTIHCFLACRALN